MRKSKLWLSAFFYYPLVKSRGQTPSRALKVLGSVTIFMVQIVFNNLWHDCECGLKNYFSQRTKIWNHWFITTANGTTNWILKWTRLEFSSRTRFQIKGWDLTKWLLCNDYVIKSWNPKNRNWRNKRHETSNGMFTKRKCVFARRNWYFKRARKP